MARFTALLILVIATLGSPIYSFAQFGGTSSGGFGGAGGGRGGSSGGFGGGMGGTSGTGGMGGGGLGGGGLGGSGSGMGGGMGGLGGGMGAGNGGFGQNGMNNGQNGMGNQQGQGFLGINNNPNNFLGRNTQGQGQNGMLNQNGGNRRGGNGRNNNNQNAFNQQGGMGGAMGNNARLAPPIRPRQRIAFEHTPPHLPSVTTKLETQLKKLPTLKSGDVKLNVSPAGEVVLTGNVESAHKAKLAENLARLEPGVRKIRNELTYPGKTE